MTEKGSLAEWREFSSSPEKPPCGFWDRSPAPLMAARGWAAACPLCGCITRQAAATRDYLIGKNRSATASCSGTSGKNAMRWQ